MFTLILANIQIAVGQNNDTLIMNNTPPAGIYEATKSIILQPGFSFTASPGNSLTLRINSSDTGRFKTRYSDWQKGYTKKIGNLYYLIDDTQSNLYFFI